MCLIVHEFYPESSSINNKYNWQRDVAIVEENIKNEFVNFFLHYRYILIFFFLHSPFFTNAHTLTALCA